jgi:hypothetical protein
LLHLHNQIYTVMKKNIIIIICCLLFQTLQAQPPWRAKLYVNFLDSNNQIVKDTVWFGFDSLGAEGYQSGLDVIDTNLQWNTVYGSDDLIMNQFNTSCPNLRNNIVSHTMGYTWFKFFALGNIKSIGWDSSDFIFQIDSNNRMTHAYINSLNGYIGFPDATKMSIRGEWIDSPGTIDSPVTFFVNQPLYAISDEPLYYHCSKYIPFNTVGYRFDLIIRTGPTMLNHINEKRGAIKQVRFDAMNRRIYWDNDLNPDLIQVYNMQGLLILEIHINNMTYADLNELNNGMYFLLIKVQQHYQTLKIIKL